MSYFLYSIDFACKSSYFLCSLSKLIEIDSFGSISRCSLYLIEFMLIVPFTKNILLLIYLLSVFSLSKTSYSKARLLFGRYGFFRCVEPLIVEFFAWSDNFWLWSWKYFFICVCSTDNKTIQPNITDYNSPVNDNRINHYKIEIKAYSKNIGMNNS